VILFTDTPRFDNGAPPTPATRNVSFRPRNSLAHSTPAPGLPSQLPAALWPSPGSVLFQIAVSFWISLVVKHRSRKAAKCQDVYLTTIG